MSSKSQPGIDAHNYTIIPSHKKCGYLLKRKFPKHLVASPIGLPDFVLSPRSPKTTKFIELKPCRLAKNQRASYKSMYLNPNQEKAISGLIKGGAYVGIIYYNKTGEKFRYTDVVKLTSKNLKRFCFSTDWEKRTDPDKLFKP
jgi:hypothetical protein